MRRNWWTHGVEAQNRVNPLSRHPGFINAEGDSWLQRLVVRGPAAEVTALPARRGEPRQGNVWTSSRPAGHRSSRLPRASAILSGSQLIR